MWICPVNVGYVEILILGYIEGTDDRENDGLQDIDTKYLMSLCEEVRYMMLLNF